MDKKYEEIPASKVYHEHLISINHLIKACFKEWVFLPAMLFGSSEKWWGTPGKRDRPHEGLDLCVFRDSEGNLRYFDESKNVPVIFEGRIEKLVDDFLGKSVFVSHEKYRRNDNRLYTIYGHISPADNIQNGELLKEGEIIGTIAGAGENIHPHLHISAAWISDTVIPDDLDWEVINNTSEITLLDPLSIIELPYSINPSQVNLP